MPAKKLTATLEEVEAVQQLLLDKLDETTKALEAKIKQASQDASGELAGEKKDIEGKIKKLSKSTDDRFAAADAKSEELQEQALQATSDLQSELHAYQKVVEKEFAKTREDLENRIIEVDTATRNEFAEELEMLCKRLEEELLDLRNSSTALSDKIAKEAAEALETRRQELDAALQAARQEARDAEAEVARVAAESLQAAVDAQAEDNAKRDKVIKKNRDDAFEKSTQIETDLKKYKDATAKLTSESKEHHEVCLRKSEEARDAKFEEVDTQIANLWTNANDMENQTTRKVDWVVNQASKQLKAPPKSDDPEEKPQPRSWLSPTFDLAGARGLVLEFKIFPPPEEGEIDQDPAAKKGDCVVMIHAPVQKGINLCFRLCIGSWNQVYENKWTDDRAFVSNRLCFYGEQINAIKDEMKISIEVLECLYELDKDLPPTIREEDDPEDPRPVLEGFMHLQRHINNRIFDQVKGQLDNFKSRNCRRVEWRLEEATEMRKSFPRGAPIVSKVFDAAGIEGMQFVFYPNGYDSSPEGFCGAYLSCPAGASLKSSLTVGKETRELNHIFEKAGYFGRSNFCRYESAMDEEEDTVLIVLDILEAQQDVTAIDRHPAPAAAGMRNLKVPAAKPLPIGSALKMQKTMDRLPPVLQEVKVLPSLWTKRNIMEPLVRMDGLKMMKDMRRSDKGGSPLGGSRSSPLLK